ncbi:hypothetical protein MKW98_018647 [Papaver atlanticum]|uniref:CW-type domain-containing protein n=1 Tax=Papaver atlanticum TaxID=357466 RepID=A0AAD4T2U9_9MAGN|nr:hypothetical protein MKW98_018647 [Papaver atlanticum]
MMGSKPIDGFGLEDGFAFYVMLYKDRKPICRTQCIKAPHQFYCRPANWNIHDMPYASKCPLEGLPHFALRPAFEDERQQDEWGKFTTFLYKNEKAAVVQLDTCVLYIINPSLKAGSKAGDVMVLFKMNGVLNDHKNTKNDESMVVSKKLPSAANSVKTGTYEHLQLLAMASGSCAEDRILTPRHEEVGESLDAHFSGRDTNYHDSLKGSSCKSELVSLKDDCCGSKNYARVDPSYLATLGHSHDGWIFGAIAELIDNSRDAKATKLEISVETRYLKKDDLQIPMLSVVDDGHGMSHQEITVMVSLGHKQTDADDPNQIGRFGIGFKTGAMKLGRDAIVLTQTTTSRSIAFLSQSFNEGKDSVEIPVVSYRRHAGFMEVDTSIQSLAVADYHLKAIKDFSPFNEYLIGEKSGLFGEKGTGTQIYIWNFDKWGSDFCLEWQRRNGDKDSPNENDILIRSRRVRSRSGQISQKVPLDYSLRSYLEVIFLEPRMKIYVQGSLVKSRPLAKSLNKTKIFKGEIKGKPVQLTLGRNQIEWDLMNCGIFLYWHGRLIEAYKRVGGMVHSVDIGRGIVGVIDVTEMSNGYKDFIMNTKQAFRDCEEYATLEQWLGEKSDEYWDEHFDTLQVKQNVSDKYKPDLEWVQCDKCRKWRALDSGFDTDTLPQTWVCGMPPYNGSCQNREEEMDPGVVTVGKKRTRCDPKQITASGTPKKVETGIIITKRPKFSPNNKNFGNTSGETKSGKPNWQRHRNGRAKASRYEER